MIGKIAAFVPSLSVHIVLSLIRFDMLSVSSCLPQVGVGPALATAVAATISKCSTPVNSAPKPLEVSTSFDLVRFQTIEYIFVLKG